MNRVWTRLTAAGCMIALVACGASAATTGVAATGLKTHTEGPASVTANSDGSVTVAFPGSAGSPMDAFTIGAEFADYSVSGGAFVDDYAAAGVKAITLVTVSDGSVPDGAQVYLLARSGRKWRNNNVRVAATPSERVLTYLPMSRDAGWIYRTRAGEDIDAYWTEDIANVVEVGVSFDPSGTQAQSYTTDDFVLAGVGLYSLQDALWDQLQALSEDEIDPAQNSDGDGASDLDELRWGTSATDAGSVPRVELVAVEEGSVTIRWPYAAGRTYKVLRAATMTDEFSDVGPLEGASIADGFMVWTDTSAGSEKFYKVTAQQSTGGGVQ